MRPLTQDVSKPCVRFLNRPLIEFSIVELAKQGIKNFIFDEPGYTNYVRHPSWKIRNKSNRRKTFSRHRYVDSRLKSRIYQATRRNN